MSGAADAGGGIGHRAGLRFGRGNQIVHAVKALGRGHDEHVGQTSKRNHSGEILHRVVGHFRIERRDDGVRRRADQKQISVSVTGVRDHPNADHAAGAGTVFDDDRLTELAGERLKHRPRNNVSRTAGRERHNGVDRFAGPVLCTVLRLCLREKRVAGAVYGCADDAHQHCRDQEVAAPVCQFHQLLFHGPAARQTRVYRRVQHYRY